jgi:hypothetical protein
MKDKKLYTLFGLSYQLKLPAKWLKQQAENGTIPALNVDGKLRFNLEAVQEAISSLAAKGGNDE